MKWEKTDSLIMCLGTLIIICFYMMAIPKIYTVWNLVDEYGYLANAAYLSGADWEAMTNFYYGYGYSLWLIPLFWLCKTGISVIRGAMIINTVFIVLLFWVQYILMSKIYKEMNHKKIALISFALCFYPYLVVSNWKVVCECLLTLMIWVCGLVLYQALDTGKWHWYMLLGVALSYTYYVHARSFVFIAILLLAVAVMYIQKNITGKNLLTLLVTGVVLFVFGGMLKNHIIDVMYTNTPGGIMIGETGNTFSVSYIFEKIIGFFKELSIVDIDSFACKIFYLFIGSAGVLPLGIYVIAKDSVQQWCKEKLVTKENVIRLMYTVAIIGMIVALVVNPMGETEGTGHYFYARYYEYLMGPVIFAGAGYCMTKKVRMRELVGLVAALLISGRFATNLAPYLETHEIYISTGHMPALSCLLEFVNWFEKVIEVGVIFTIGLMILLGLLSIFKRLRWAVPVVLLSLFMLSNIWNVLFVVRINGANMAEYQVANYIHENYDAEEIYFLNDDSNAVLAYTKIQSLLGNVKVDVVNPEDAGKIQSREWFVTLQFNPYVSEMAETEMVLKQGCYEVYVVD